MLEYTKKNLEKYVPALRSATPEVSERVSSFFQGAQRKLASTLCFDNFDSLLLEEISQALIEEYAYTEAARQAVSSLDLVATSTGFGVVQNQNVAPASAHRVAALKEDLRIRCSEVKDAIIFELQKAGNSLAHYINSLFYCPTIARRYGITTSTGGAVYDEELDTIRVQIQEAEDKVVKAISPELYEELIEQIIVDDGRDTYTPICDLARQAIATMMQGKTADLTRLLSLIDQSVDDLPAYKNSATYRSYKSANYENKEEDATYFFA